MLGGKPISSLTLFTAFTASPREALGARLKESVMTGNWPWGFTVMGRGRGSTRVRALRGTWPPVGNTVEDAMAPPPNAVLAWAALAAFAAAVAAELVLAGPCESAAVDEPPATRPAAVALDPAGGRADTFGRSGGIWR